MARTSEYTSAERSAHLTQWKDSGLNQTAYCKQYKINYQLFNKWVYKSRETISINGGTTTSKKFKISKSEKNFIPIGLIEPPSVSNPILMKVEIEFPDGTKLRIN